jgi:hypothetical protein
VCRYAGGARPLAGATGAQCSRGWAQTGVSPNARMGGASSPAAGSVREARGLATHASQCPGDFT